MLDKKEFMTAQELYASLNGYKLEGDVYCHWCANKCTRNWITDGTGIVPFVKYISTAKVPSSKWMCAACVLFKRPRVTIKFLDETYKDGKCPADYNWWVSTTECRAIPNIQILNPIYERLLNPPLTFFMCLTSPNQKLKNELHLTLLNNHEKILADTELKYTLNNKPMSYTIYELKEALRNGEEGKSPGVRTLLEMFGKCEEIERRNPETEEKRKRGRPPKVEEFSDARILKKVVRD